MTRDKDYRNTEYCPVMDRVEEQKKTLEKEIRSEYYLRDKEPGNWRDG